MLATGLFIRFLVGSIVFNLILSAWLLKIGSHWVKLPDLSWNHRSDPVGGPWRLGPDEYFVLGDFSRVAKDSRLSDPRAPSPSAHAVPESHLVGVVCDTYWPQSRWRAFR